MGLEVNHALVKSQIEAVEKLLSTDPDNEKRIRKIIKEAISQARNEVVVAGSAKIPNDPHHSLEAVRMMTYKAVLGGQLNILSSRKNEALLPVPSEKKIPSKKRGGNRVKRSERTSMMDRYSPKQRGFILRWLNNGTGVRTAGTRGGKLSGNRGQIAARNWFLPAAETALRKAMIKIGEMIEEELNKKMK